MPSNHERNTEGLRQYAALKKEKAIKRVDEAIRQLVKDKQRVTFNSVAQAAGVAKSYLYAKQERFFTPPVFLFYRPPSQNRRFSVFMLPQ